MRPGNRLETRPFDQWCIGTAGVAVCFGANLVGNLASDLLGIYGSSITIKPKKKLVFRSHNYIYSGAITDYGS